ncbi:MULTISPECIES: hypothetical protein [Paenibacillus]|uniref:Uncharacterized protein n=1 Tax=Paenibacillus amylolyticus TaxID=1451 RepID=A0AAP5H5H8_PAEAM|nr:MULTISPECIES: hypothetical protein [Paenibacillus]MDR6725381.1 hypothetical protein [Paenibacillus amylolyticus]
MGCVFVRCGGSNAARSLCERRRASLRGFGCRPLRPDGEWLSP